MTPKYRILADDDDITAAIADRLLSLTITDESGGQTDTVTIEIDNRDKQVAFPRKGVLLAVDLGYAESGLVSMGRYTVDEIELGGPPDKLVIRAHAADMGAGLKERRTRSWDQVTLGDLVATIASEQGLTPKTGPDLAGVQIAHIDQTDESDMNLLTRLGKQYGAVAKVAQGFLIFAPRGQAKSVSGKQIPAVFITESQVSSYRFTFADRGKYKAVIAHWHNTATGERVPVKAGSGKPADTLPGNKPDAATAYAAAAARLAALQRGEGSGSITLPGDPRLAAEGAVTLSGFMDGVDGTWVAQRVTHALKGGYTTTVSLETKK